MLIFGHIGYGTLLVRLVKKWLPKLPYRYFLLGTLFPDLLDKPAYFIAMSGYKRDFWSEPELITGTRTFGHTILLTLAIGAYGWFSKKKLWMALALGSATHLILDPISDLFRSGPPTIGPPSFFFPLYGLHFQTRFPDPSWTLWEQLMQPVLIGTELSGVMIIVFYLYKTERAKDGL